MTLVNSYVMTMSYRHHDGVSLKIPYNNGISVQSYEFRSEKSWTRHGCAVMWTVVSLTLIAVYLAVRNYPMIWFLKWVQLAKNVWWTCSTAVAFTLRRCWFSVEISRFRESSNLCKRKIFIISSFIVSLGYGK